MSRPLRLCLYLTRMEFERRFAGTLGGKVWVFVGPVLTIGVIWFALEVGLRLKAIAGPTYGAALAVGLTAWLFFAESINAALATIIGSPHLVKKVVFPVELLPISTVLAAFVVHVLLVLLISLGVMVQHGVSWTVLTLPIWMLLLLVSAMSISVIVAGLNVVLRDVGALVPNLVSFLFWLTPVVWPISNVPETWRWLVLLNPMAIVVEGYRYALLGPTYGVSAITASLLVLGLGLLAFGAFALFRRVRPLFANVL